MNKKLSNRIIKVIFFTITFFMLSVSFANAKELNNMNNLMNLISVSNVHTAIVENSLSILSLNNDIVDDTWMTIRQIEFVNKMMKYATPVFLFLVIIFLLSAAVYVMIVNQDAEKRVLVKEKIKNILIAVLLFSIVTIIIAFTREFVASVFEQMNFEAVEIKEVKTVGSVSVKGFFMNLVADVIDILNQITKAIVDALLRVVTSGKMVNNPAELIMGYVSDSGKSLDPFSKEDWQRYTYGYNALFGIMFMLLSIALIKVVCEFYLYAGNVEKIEEAKKSSLRILLALLASLLGPYIFRLILLFFNYLVELIPMESSAISSYFNIKFENKGIVGSIADISFYWIKIKIYLTFIVKKVMLAFMFLITPIVFGFWAISDKTRGVSLWIGEIITNAAMKFFYALTFFIIRFILQDTNNAFMILIAVTVLMRMVNFFRDSLQGLVQKWGGIDEEGVAGDALDRMKNSAKRTKNIANTLRKGTGGLLMKASTLADKNKITKGGRIINNIGAVIATSPRQWRTKKDVARSVASAASQRSGEVYQDVKYQKEKVSNQISNIENESEKRMYTDTYNRILSGGEFSDEELKEMKNKGGIDGELEKLYHKNKEYVRAQSIAKAARERVNKKVVFGKIRDKFEEGKVNRYREKYGTKESSPYVKPTVEESDSKGGFNQTRTYSGYKGEYVDTASRRDGNSEATKNMVDFLVAKTLFENNEINSEEFLQICADVSDRVLDLDVNESFARHFQLLIGEELKNSSIDVSKLGADKAKDYKELVGGANVPPLSLEFAFDEDTVKDELKMIKKATDEINVVNNLFKKINNA